jgi:hypothetical protein
VQVTTAIAVEDLVLSMTVIVQEVTLAYRAKRPTTGDFVRRGAHVDEVVSAADHTRSAKE